ncbi:MAG: type II toxin-antitoxin system VapC family toxin [Treponema sp.]|nr:type II toxin-antitoxin system VapC family toxin [Treponema sp.]
MRYLLDTNVISELQKHNCNPNVKAFTDEIPWEELFICSITIGELCYGVEKLSACKKKHDLLIWFNTKLPQWFDGRIISLDTETMSQWGRICACTGRTLPMADSLIASAAITHHMILVTRNTKDFEGIEGITLVNPWEYSCP